MKASSIGLLKIYLVENVGKVQLPNGVESYDIIMIQYVKEAVKNVDKYLHDRGIALMKKLSTPLYTNYSPEVYGSPELDEKEAAFYQSLIEILQWMVEMGRLDICMEVSEMSYFVSMQIEGHLRKLLYMFVYLNINHNSWIVFDP